MPSNSSRSEKWVLRPTRRDRGMEARRAVPTLEVVSSVGFGRGLGAGETTGLRGVVMVPSLTAAPIKAFLYVDMRRILKGGESRNLPRRGAA